MKRKLINTIKIDAANLEFIAKTGKINGTLLIEIERVMTDYARQQANVAERSSDKCHIQNVSNSALPSLPEFAAANFDSVVELAQRLTTGNVSHQGRTIEGLAKRNAEFIRKHYC